MAPGFWVSYNYIWTKFTDLVPYLGSFGELEHSMSDVPEKRPFIPEKAAIQPYQDIDYQMVGILTTYLLNNQSI